MIETIQKNSSHSKDRHVFRARTLLGNAIFDHLTLQKSSVITVDGVQLNGVDHTLPGFCTKGRSNNYVVRLLDAGAISTNHLPKSGNRVICASIRAIASFVSLTPV